MLIVLFVMLTATGSTQNPTDRDAVLKVVQTFFDTMAAKGVDGARKIMGPEGRFYAMDMLKPTIVLASFTSEEYFVRLQQTKQNAARTDLESRSARARGGVGALRLLD